jgi:hypothetical protein
MEPDSPTGCAASRRAPPSAYLGHHEGVSDGNFRQRDRRDPSPDPGYGIGRAIRPRAPATRPYRHARIRCTETA